MAFGPDLHLTTTTLTIGFEEEIPGPVVVTKKGDPKSSWSQKTDGTTQIVESTLEVVGY